MADYQTILDLFRHVREMGLCTTPFCSTCGATEYRNLCKSLGHDEIRRLLEATTSEDLAYTHPSLWYDPLTIMLYDGFRCNLDCPIMRSYEKGYEWLLYGDAIDLLFKEGDCSVFAKTGSIFEEKTVDVLVIFENPGYFRISSVIDTFFSENALRKEQCILIPSHGMIGDVKAVYYARVAKSNSGFREITKILETMLYTITKAGYSSVAMNGIKTLGYSEYDNVRIIKDWISTHQDTSLKRILLIDKKAGFTKLANKEMFGPNNQ